MDEVTVISLFKNQKKIFFQVFNSDQFELLKLLAIEAETELMVG